jgi:hypothetical protein
MGRAPTLIHVKTIKPATNETRNFVPLRQNSMGGGTMSRDTLLYRVSLIWLAVLTAGCVYMLLTL